MIFHEPRAIPLLALLLSTSAGGNQFESKSLYELTLDKNEGIEFRRETIHFTRDRVVVEYRFFNPQKPDRKAKIVFPMPDIEPHGYLSQFQPANLRFKANADGKSIPDPFVARAFRDGKDITAELKSRKIYFAEYYLTGEDAALEKAVKDGLAEKKIENSDFEDGDSPLVPIFYPKFTTEVTFEWDQTFKGKSETIVTIEFYPFMGSDDGYSGSRPWLGQSDLDYEYFSYFRFRRSGANGPYPKKAELFVNERQLVWTNFRDSDDIEIGPAKFARASMPAGEWDIVLIKGNLRRTIDGPANCRKDPMASSPVLKSLRNGTVVVAKARKDDWYRLEFEGASCWTKRNNLKRAPEKPNPGEETVAPPFTDGGRVGT
ncbi:MAG: DUF4424 family protein [Bdellovibrionales bacterium]|nr:DUF4424 family protein [Bdellovibrionales bacterium]